MSAWRDAIAVRTTSPRQQLADAVRVLGKPGGIVVLDAVLALRSTVQELHCEVIDPAPSAHRCAFEFEVLVENARRKLESSPLHDLLPNLPRRWSVVENGDDGAIELWRAP